MWYLKLVETNIVPDWLIRLAIRTIIEKSTRRKYQASREDREVERLALLDRLRQSPIAVDADQANRQHYEVPAEFFHLVLGARKSIVVVTGRRASNRLMQQKTPCSS